MLHLCAHQWVGAPLAPNARIDRHGPWRRDVRRKAEGMMTAEGWIRNGAVSEVESKVRQVRAWSFRWSTHYDWIRHDGETL
jgi:hypothetical protein